MRRPRLSGARSTWAAAIGGVDLLDELDLGLLEEAVQFLEVAVVQVDLGDGGLDLREGQDAHLLTLEQQGLDLFEFLQIE